MNQTNIINQLSQNKAVFNGLLTGLSEKEYTWRPAPEKWCLQEIVCHLYDEEREDFRIRTKLVLEDPTQVLPPIDPPAWVKNRAYMSNDYNNKLTAFLKEREHSINWLQSLESPKWDNAYSHETFGDMSAHLFLSNWLAHDYLHIRQILRLKFEYLKQESGVSLDYAGDW